MPRQGGMDEAIAGVTTKRSWGASQLGAAERSRVHVHQRPRLAEEAQPSCVPLAYLLAQNARSSRLQD